MAAALSSASPTTRVASARSCAAAAVHPLLLAAQAAQQLLGALLCTAHACCPACDVLLSQHMFWHDTLVVAISSLH